MEGIDYSRLPGWITIILLILYFFREQIRQILPTAVQDIFRFKASRQVDREEHRQRLEVALLDREIQDRVTEQMQESRREESLIQIIRTKDEWLEKILTARLEKLQEGQEKVFDELKKISGGVERTNNILTTIHIALSKRDQHGN